MNYEISVKANEDIEKIWLYTLETWGQEQADRYYNLILDEIKYITNNFENGKSMEFLRKGYRATKVKSHLIFYRKNKKSSVEIIRILHQKMDVESRLVE